jgi:hypothetical protein
MNTLSSITVLNSVVELLTEAYAGPPDPSTTWFIDNAPNSGVLGMLEEVSALEASKSVDGSGETGTTIAAHGFISSAPACGLSSGCYAPNDRESEILIRDFASKGLGARRPSD